MSERMTEAEFNSLLIRRVNRDGTAERLCSVAHAEITALRAEVEKLNKSRNKWGQKYNKLLEQHAVTLSQLTTAVWSDTEECKLLTAEVEKLRAALARIENEGDGAHAVDLARAALEGK